MASGMNFLRKLTIAALLALLPFAATAVPILDVPLFNFVVPAIETYPVILVSMVRFSFTTR